MKRLIAKQNFSKKATLLLPGLKIKRWVLLLFLGALLFALGTSILFNLTPIHYILEVIKEVAQNTPSHITGPLFLILGSTLFFKGLQNANGTILDALSPRERGQLLESLYRKRMLDRGPRIVVVGGGTGLSTILRGLKNITNNLTAIVTVGDDGGSSGRLRKEMGVLPPGDIRNCIAALADEEDLVTKLFQYRFPGGGLGGHSFGNLFLTALCSITGDMFNAVKESSKVLAIRGKVLPSTLDDIRLVAEMKDGRIIEGESNIPEAKGKIKELTSEPTSAKTLDDVKEAIEEAELIILGPGSLYTSVIPNLLIGEIASCISKSNANKFYICNVMTQPGETDGYSASNHVEAILNHAKLPNIIDAVIVNKALPKELAHKYKEAGSFPVEIDDDVIKKMNIKVIKKDLIEKTEDGFVRHSHTKLSKVVLNLYKKFNKNSLEDSGISEDVITEAD